MGCCYEAFDQTDKARTYFEKASSGLREPVQAIYYNDQQPDKIFYQGLALKKLNREGEAAEIFNRLITFGTAHLNDKIKIDYFAVSLPDLLVFDQDLDLRNRIHCHFLIALGHLGLNNLSEADKNFNFVLAHNINHQGAAIHKALAAPTSVTL